MIREAIQKLVQGEGLSEQESFLVMEEIMGGRATAAQIGAFITALRIKGVTTEEITGAARVLRQRVSMRGPLAPPDGPIVDTCGTGGDGANTFNVSTATALVVAAVGIKVAKHGNRSVSSRCGSADLMEALGVNIHCPPERAWQCLHEIGIAFLYAPLFHKAMRHAMGPRREIGIRSVFNLLGPLSNPLGADVQILGVYDRELTSIMAEVLKRLGSKGAMVVHGEDGLDEITICGRTQVSELAGGNITTYIIAPEQLGLRRATLEEIRGGNPEQNARIVEDILSGKSGPRTDMVLLNAAAALKAAAVVDNLVDGMEMARRAIESGRAKEKLRQLIEFTNRP